MLTLALFASAVASTGSSELDRQLDLLHRLEAAAVTINLVDEPVEDVVREFAAQLPLSLRADWEELTAAGVADYDRMSIHMDGVPASTALTSLAHRLSGPFSRIRFDAYGGEIILTSQQSLRHMQLTAIYDLRDLAAHEEIADNLRENLPEAPEAGSATDTDEPAGAEVDEQDDPLRKGRKKHVLPAMLPDPPEHEEHDDRDELDSEASRETTAAQKLMYLLTEHIESDAWINFGGDRANVAEKDGVLIVTAPASIHLKLRRLLHSLRELAGTDLSYQAAIVETSEQQLRALSRRYERGSFQFGQSLLNNEDSTLRWQSGVNATRGQMFEARTNSGESTCSISILPRWNESSQVLTLRVHVRIGREGTDVELSTDVAVTDRRATITLELPRAGDGENVTLLVLRPQTR